MQGYYSREKLLTRNVDYVSIRGIKPTDNQSTYHHPRAAMKTKPTLILAALFALIVAFLSSSFAAGPVPMPPQLRQGVECDTVTIATALELVNQGWIYTMPQPKSTQANSEEPEFNLKTIADCARLRIAWHGLPARVFAALRVF